MAINWYNRSDAFLRSDISRVTLGSEHFFFNARFVKVANLNDYSRVRWGFDNEDYTVHFKFIKKDDNSNNAGSLALFSSGAVTKAVGAMILYRQYPVLKRISEFLNKSDRQFEGKQDPQDPDHWWIQICPSFDKITYVNSDRNILKDVLGIYQLKNEGEIVYIGQGEIFDRINSHIKKGLKFDTILYSNVPNRDERGKWENFWLKRFEEEHGHRPLYNKNNGKYPQK